MVSLHLYVCPFLDVSSFVISSPRTKPFSHLPFKRPTISESYRLLCKACCSTCPRRSKIESVEHLISTRYPKMHRPRVFDSLKFVSQAKHTFRTYPYELSTYAANVQVSCQNGAYKCNSASMVSCSLDSTGSNVSGDGRLLHKSMHIPKQIRRHWKCAEILQVYALEKVLNLKKDTATHVVFIDEAMKVHSWFFCLALFHGRVFFSC